MLTRLLLLASPLQRAGQPELCRGVERPEFKSVTECRTGFPLPIELGQRQANEVKDIGIVWHELHCAFKRVQRFAGITLALVQESKVVPRVCVARMSFR